MRFFNATGRITTAKHDEGADVFEEMYTKCCSIVHRTKFLFTWNHESAAKLLKELSLVENKVYFESRKLKVIASLRPLRLIAPTGYL